MRKLFKGDKSWPPEKTTGPWVAFVQRQITTREIAIAHPGQSTYQVAAFDSRYSKEFYRWTQSFVSGRYHDDGTAHRLPYRGLFACCQVCSGSRYVKVRGDFRLHPCPRWDAEKQECRR